MAGLNWISFPIEIKLGPNHMTIDGIEMNYMVLAQIISEVIHPQPNRWYRMERTGNILNVHVRVSEEEPDGTRINQFGRAERREEDPQPQGSEAAHSPNGD